MKSVSAPFSLLKNLEKFIFLATFFPVICHTFCPYYLLFLDIHVYQVFFTNFNNYRIYPVIIQQYFAMHVCFAVQVLEVVCYLCYLFTSIQL
jgi:hypothetical protein